MSVDRFEAALCDYEGQPGGGVVGLPDGATIVPLAAGIFPHSALQRTESQPLQPGDPNDYLEMVSVFGVHTAAYPHQEYHIVHSDDHLDSGVTVTRMLFRNARNHRLGRLLRAGMGCSDLVVAHETCVSRPMLYLPNGLIAGNYVRMDDGSLARPRTWAFA